MREITTEIGIDASPERVWAVLTDFASYPGWNPFIHRIEGPFAVGARLDVAIRLPGKERPSRFRPNVTALEPGRTLEWLGGPRGIFNGRHRFEVEPDGSGGARFVHSERFTGVLAAPIVRSIGTATRAGFVAMNEAIRERAESL